MKNCYAIVSKTLINKQIANAIPCSFSVGLDTQRELNLGPLQTFASRPDPATFSSLFRALHALSSPDLVFLST